MGFTPSVGDELQTEYHFERGHAPAAIETVRGLAEAMRPVLQVCELRTIAADRLWMSTQYERDTFAIHFTWAPEPAAVGRVLAQLEEAVAPLDPRPHWGKLFHAEDLGARYPRTGDFLALRERLDPRGAFVNDWLTRTLNLRR
jgi:xylitol oxidase